MLLGRYYGEWSPRIEVPDFEVTGAHAEYEARCSAESTSLPRVPVQAYSRISVVERIPHLERSRARSPAVMDVLYTFIKVASYEP